MIELEKDINKLAKTILDGGIICIPTDTLYALSCDATNPSAITKLYQIKNRGYYKKLPIFLRTIEDVDMVCILNDSAIKLARRFWPGKLTMVLPLKKNINIINNTAEQSIAVRIPGDNDILNLLEICGVPLVGTSANISGKQNIKSYDDLRMQLRDYNMNNVCMGVTIKCFDVMRKASQNIIQQSTIVGFDGVDPILLRDGEISLQDIKTTVSNN